jgi:hypothetical protein
MAEEEKEDSRKPDANKTENASVSPWRRALLAVLGDSEVLNETMKRQVLARGDLIPVENDGKEKRKAGKGKGNKKGKGNNKGKSEDAGEGKDMVVEIPLEVNTRQYVCYLRRRSTLVLVHTFLVKRHFVSFLYLLHLFLFVPLLLFYHICLKKRWHL